MSATFAGMARTVEMAGMAKMGQIGKMGKMAKWVNALLLFCHAFAMKIMAKMAKVNFAIIYGKNDFCYVLNG